MTSIAESISHTEYAKLLAVSADAKVAADEANLTATSAKLDKVRADIAAAKAAKANPAS